MAQMLIEIKINRHQFKIGVDFFYDNVDFNIF